jgi:hypothetical protein
MLIIVFGIASLWDAFTTVYGTWSVLGRGWPQVIVSILVAIVVLAFLVNSARVWKGKDSPQSAIWAVLWFVAVGYDLYTSFLGNRDFLLSGVASDEQMIVLVGLTVLVSGSPILSSFR